MQTHNNSANTFLINPNIILYYVFLSNIYVYLKHHQHQHYHNCLKNHRYWYNPVFFILSDEKYFETLPKYNGAPFI